MVGGGRDKLVAMRLAAERAGQPTPVPFPHPDDIVIDPTVGVRFVGPMNAEEQANMEDTIRLRDLLLVQDHYDQRECMLGEGDDPEKGAGAALLFVHALNARLPERHRLSTLDMILQTMPLGRLTKRELQKLLFRELKARGCSVSRGKTVGSINDGKRALTAVYQALTDVENGKASPSMQTDNSIESQIRRALEP